MNFFRQHIKYLFILLFPAASILLYNSAVNIHSHQLNGNIVTHAHPYSSNDKDPTTPFQNHKHTSLEFLLLNKIFNLFLTIVIGIAAFQIILLSNYDKISILLKPVLQVQHISSSHSRAPPQF